jgi:hypothetical protein
MLAYPRLAAAIAESDVSHADLAAAAGCAPQTISFILRGHLRASQPLRERIAASLGGDVDELFAIGPDVARLLEQAAAELDPVTARRVAALIGGGPDAPAA